jgi:hypothetical protein
MRCSERALLAGLAADRQHEESDSRRIVVRHDGRGSPTTVSGHLVIVR